MDKSDEAKALIRTYEQISLLLYNFTEEYEKNRKRRFIKKLIRPFLKLANIIVKKMGLASRIKSSKLYDLLRKKGFVG